MTYRKRTTKNKGLSQIQKRSVTTIAKRVVHKEAETKSAINNRTADLTNDLVYAQNLNFFLQQGSNAENIVGEKLHLKNIYIKGRVYSYNTIGAGNSTTHVRLTVIRTKKALTNTFSSILYDDVFRGYNTELASTGFLDLHKIDVIKDMTMKIPQTTIGTTGTSSPFTMNLKINKTCFTDSDNSGYFKDKNYYLIVTSYKADNPAVTTVSAVRFQWALNFKDL